MTLTDLVEVPLLTVVMGMAIVQKAETVADQQGLVQEQQEEHPHLVVMVSLMSACLFRRVLASAALLLPRVAPILRCQLNLALLPLAPCPLRRIRVILSW